MKAHIVRIGNSKGIRLPKTLLQEAQLEDEVELQAEPGRILISKSAQPRAGWTDAARRMRAQGEDGLLDPPTATRFDKEDWKWR
ncbi:AbrB/MazE/SpoVT family DNA-binding domain-containing protein [Candidatus Nitrospira nitrificans]|jgi:antitoxin MazE|uniref:SpoVT/AbrB domain-containing protein n=1 Tax=Candidatus Nitrospira nitrificans TaxID=1742973 RepID=A0A0S4LAK7_9BACT|nr:AbrB/MazE/SpoVT family DNA-binding domain-containing protein [Candidatus Nitrospira nitrificans]CUS34769.1 SpoVT/AbrB domain-containing protein [Candidatus Nitrospira nitrificans]